MTITSVLRFSRLFTALAVLALSGCYYLRTAQGQAALMLKRQPIERVLRQPDTDAVLRSQLEAVQRIRAFAAEELGLPARRQYGSYVELGRDYPVWSVVAAPALSLTPRTWCYWLVGCLSYRGFFNEAAALRYADALQRQGLEVYLSGISAYSTLGWFRDPVLSSFVHWPEAELAELLFHELTHQVLFVPGDTVFNESLAVTVAQEGLHRYAQRQGLDLSRVALARQRERQFVALILEHRRRLESLFADAASDEEKRRGKAELYASLVTAYDELKRSWGGYDGYDQWMSSLNNAKLNSVATYYQLVPPLQALLRANGGDMAKFLAACRELAQLDLAARHRRLETMLAQRAAIPSAF